MGYGLLSAFLGSRCLAGGGLLCCKWVGSSSGWAWGPPHFAHSPGGLDQEAVSDGLSGEVALSGSALGSKSDTHQVHPRHVDRWHATWVVYTTTQTSVSPSAEWGKDSAYLVVYEIIPVTYSAGRLAPGKCRADFGRVVTRVSEPPSHSAQERPVSFDTRSIWCECGGESSGPLAASFPDLLGVSPSACHGCLP